MFVMMLNIPGVGVNYLGNPTENIINAMKKKKRKSKEKPVLRISFVYHVKLNHSISFPFFKSSGRRRSNRIERI